MTKLTVADGVQIFYEIQGDGPQILFVHEFVGDYRSWARQVGALKSDYRCITFSARGFWPSDVPDDEACYGQSQSSSDVLALLDHLGLEAVHLVGTSMGSFTILDVALTHPERVLSLTLVGNSSGPRNAREREHYQLNWLEQEIRMRLTHGQAGAVDVLQRDPAYQSFQANDPEGWAIYASNLAQQPIHGAIHILKTLHRNRISLFSQADRIRVFPKPVLLVNGTEDYYLVGETGNFLARTLPHCNHLRFDRTGHLANIERAPQFNAALISHITKVGAGRYSHIG